MKKFVPTCTLIYTVFFSLYGLIKFNPPVCTNAVAKAAIKNWCFKDTNYVRDSTNIILGHVQGGITLNRRSKTDNKEENTKEKANECWSLTKDVTQSSELVNGRLNV